jgi:polysaccharide biosynthesis transport protein
MRLVRPNSDLKLFNWRPIGLLDASVLKQQNVDEQRTAKALCATKNDRRTANVLCAKEDNVTMAAPSPFKTATPSLAQFSPLSLLRMLWLHRLAVLLTWLVVSVITAAVVQTLPAVYEAEASILVLPQNIPPNVVQSMVTTNVEDRLATITQQILSNQQLQKVVDDFTLYRKEKKELLPEEITLLVRNKIKVEMQKGWTNNSTGAFKVSFQGEDPATVSQVANRLAQLFIEDNMTTRQTQVEGTSEFLETQLADAKKRLEDSEGAMAQYRLKHNGELPEQFVAITNYIQKLETERTNDKAEKARIEDNQKTLQDSIPLAEATLNGLLEQDAQAQEQAGAAQAAQTAQAVLAAAQAGRRATPGPKSSAAAPPSRPLKESEQLEAQLALMTPKYGPNHPDVKRLKMEIAQAKAGEAKIAELGLPGVPARAAADSAAQSSEASVDEKSELDKNKEDAIVATAAAPNAPAVAVSNPIRRERPEITQARERIRTLHGEVEKYDKQIAQLAQEDERLVKAAAEANARLNDVPVREQEIAQLMRDHAAYENQYNALRTKAEQVKISTDMELRQKSERFALNDPAHVPGRPISPNRMVLDIGGSLVGLVLGLVNALAQEFRKNRLLGAWELPEDVMVLAQVPLIQAPQPAPATGIWSGWGWPRRFALISGALIPILALAYAARGYLGFNH